jgi:hypothetical protein
MRRSLATLLVSVISLSLIAPALITDSESYLPACCRRGGEHHCAMKDMAQDAAEAPSGPVFAAHTDKCPYFPKGGALLPHSGIVLACSSRLAASVTFSQFTPQAQAEAADRTSFNRSHQKRGPPILPS